MDSLQIAEQLIKRQEARSEGKKLVLLVLDGLGDIRHGDNEFRTPLEDARTPNLDKLAHHSAVGRIIPVDHGITPGSGPAHLGLFGYDPREVEIGRGVMEVVGMGMALQPGDVAARANFCTMKDGKVTDRRAGRPSTEDGTRTVERLREKIRTIGDVEVILLAGQGHRFGVVFRGPGLAAGVNDTDPHENGRPLHEARAETEAAVRAGTLSAVEGSTRLLDALVTDIREGGLDTF